MTNPDDEDPAQDAVEVTERVDQAALDRATQVAQDALRRAPRPHREDTT